LAAHASVAARAVDERSTLQNLGRGLQQALLSRDVIGQAKGILMERLKITPEDAFDLLRRSSQHLNVKLRRWPEASPRPATSEIKEPSSTPTKQSGRSPLPRVRLNTNRWRSRMGRTSCTPHRVRRPPTGETTGVIFTVAAGRSTGHVGRRRLAAKRGHRAPSGGPSRPGYGSPIQPDPTSRSTRRVVVAAHGRPGPDRPVAWVGVSCLTPACSSSSSGRSMSAVVRPRRLGRRCTGLAALRYMCGCG
jgi:hypothetical protein